MRDPECMTPIEAAGVLQNATLYVSGKRSENRSPALDEALLILVCAWCQFADVSGLNGVAA